MKISPIWLREFVDYKVDVRQLAADLTQVGIAVETVSGQGDAAIFEMEITTNRPDAMNHYGVARECSAIYDLNLKPIRPKLPPAKGKIAFQIKIAEPALCARYTARIIRNTSIVPSPAKVASRLASMDAHPINNAVDASNYTLIEMGHPTHAFDLDLLQGGKIIVRKARAGETLRTLDGVERNLHPEDLVIADARRAVALGGVMGGFDTMITERTRNVLIESAWFDLVSIRKTARRHGMHTDASHRFERGADWSATSLACARVAQMILESGGGELVGQEIDAVARRIKRPVLKLRRTELRRILGIDLEGKSILRVLNRLGFEASGKGAEYRVSLPSWRLDVEREIDLIEEVARIYGYNRFPNTLPAFAGEVMELPQVQQEAKLRSTLLALGYNEAVSMTFVSPEEAQEFASVRPVELENPLSEEASVMRTSLVPGMLAMVGHNLNRGIRHIRLFEAGNTFELEGDRSREQKQLAVAGSGSALDGGSHSSTRPYSFFELKGHLETLLQVFQHNALYYDAHVEAGYYHPGRSARAVMDEVTMARFGQLHPEVAARHKLKQDVFIAEVSLERLFQHPLRQVRYRAASRFPAVERDFSFLFESATSFEQIRFAVQQLEIAELRELWPAEVVHGGELKGGAVPEGKLSMLLRVAFQSQERTLRDQEVAVWSGRIVEALRALGGIQRA